MNFLLRLIINGVVFYCLQYFVPGIHVHNFGSAIIAALIFGIVNAILRPIVLLLTLPFTILTLGLFVLIVNALMFWLVSWIAPGYVVDTFWAAFIGAIVMMIVSFLTNHLLKSERATRTA